MTRTPLQLPALHAELRDHGVDLRPPLTLDRIGRGRSNLTHLLRDAAGTRLVLRTPPPGARLDTAHDVERETRILTALRPTAVPLPRVRAGYRSAAAGEVAVLVTDHVDGLVLDTPAAAARAAPAARAGVGPGLARALAAVHSVDIVTAGLAGLASHDPYARRQLRRWSRQWEDSRTRDVPAVDRLTRLLHAHVPRRTTLTLVHGDPNVANVVVDPADGTTRALLDWELATLGDPLADLGSLLAYWIEPGEPSTGPFGVTALPGFSTRADLVHAYVQASGAPVDDLAFWHVLGLWKIAIIAEGVHRRAAADPLAGPSPLDPVAYVDELVQRAFAITAAAGWTACAPGR